MDEKTTRGLSRILEEMEDHGAADSFISDHGIDGDETFHSFLQRHVEAKEMDRAEVVKRCGISSNYVYQILSGAKSNPGRDKIIALCIASEMTYKQTQRALEISGLAPLYPRDERDVRIAIAINSGVNDALEVNLLLDRYGLDPLDV